LNLYLGLALSYNLIYIVLRSLESNPYFSYELIVERQALLL